MKDNSFLSVIHDLRTPLTAARASAQLQLMLLNSSDLGTQVRDLATKIIENIDRIDHMTRNILDQGYPIEGDEPTFKMENCRLPALVRGVLKTYSSAFGDRFRLENSVDVEGIWNSDGIRSSIENLVSNAVKYGSPTSPITLRILSDQDHVRILVHNECNHLTRKDHEKLRNFQPTSAVETQGIGGWGMGLFIVRKVMKTHGGEIRVDSSDDRGTTYTLILPKDSRHIGSEERRSSFPASPIQDKDWTEEDSDAESTDA